VNNMFESKKEPDKPERYHQPSNYPNTGTSDIDRALKDLKKVEKK